MHIYNKDNQGRLIFSPAFFQSCMAESLQDPSLKVLDEHYDIPIGVTPTTKMKYAVGQERLLGLFEYDVKYVSKGKQYLTSLLIKSKTHYKELLKKLSQVLIKAGMPFQENTLANHLNKTALHNTHIKEIKIFQLALKNPQLGRYIPRVYGTYINEETNTYIILEEFLKDAYVIKDYQDISFWNNTKIIAAIRDLSHLHATYYQNYNEIIREERLGFVMNTQRMKELTPLWEGYANLLQSYEDNLLTKEDIALQNKLIETLSDWWSKIDAMPKSLIYNDLQIRNLAMQPLANQDWRLYLYDWECAAIQLPQRDLIELLSYVIKENVSDSELETFFETGRLELEKASGKKISKNEWIEGCLYSLYDFRLDRLACQLTLSKILFRVDIARVFKASKRLLTYLKSSLHF